MASTLISSVLSISNDHNTKPVFGTGNFNPVTSRSYVGEATSDDRPQRALSYESGCETLAAYPIINGFLLDGFTGDAHTLTELESLDMELIALGDGNLTETLACTGEADNETFTSPTDHGLAVGDYVHITAITGGTGSGITASTTTKLYVKTVPSSTTFTLSTTSGGSTIAFTTDITACTVITHPGITIAITGTGVPAFSHRFYGPGRVVFFQKQNSTDRIQLASALLNVTAPLAAGEAFNFRLTVKGTTSA